MSAIINIYEGIFQYSGHKLPIVLDKNKKVWFYGKAIAQILGYVNATKAVRTKVDTDNKTEYIDIKYYSRYRYNAPDHAVFINESGFYQLILRSKMKKAIIFQRWITNEVIPMILKNGEYILDPENKEKVEDINQTIQKYKQRIKILESNQSKPKYPDGGFVYAILPPFSDMTNDETGNELLKIGKVGKSLNNRINVYNTSYPDSAILIYKIKVGDPIGVEQCIKAHLRRYVYRDRKEFYKLPRSLLIKIMEQCAKSIREVSEDGTDTESEDHALSRVQAPDNDSEEIPELFEIFSITKEEVDEAPSIPYYEPENQNGGEHSYIVFRKIYLENKLMYINLKSIK